MKHLAPLQMAHPWPVLHPHPKRRISPSLQMACPRGVPKIRILPLQQMAYSRRVSKIIVPPPLQIAYLRRVPKNRIPLLWQIADLWRALRPHPKSRMTCPWGDPKIRILPLRQMAGSRRVPKIIIPSSL